jgi:basic amino acid/polyamine antiporter, APA family
MTTKVAPLKPTLSIVDASAIIVGMVVGSGIFVVPALVAQNVNSEGTALFAWALGGLMSLVGALCYAELATAYPHAGGTYYYFLRAFGRDLAFFFAWGRLAIIQTGSIALLAFVFGKYAAQILPLGNFAVSVYAAIGVVVLTGLNLLSVQQGKWTQNLLTLAKVLGVLLIIVVGLTANATTTPVAPTDSSSDGTFGLAMVFVLLTYGGWNEAAYISAELKNVQRNMSKVLLWSIGIIAGIYLLINVAYLQGLGLAGMATSDAVAADLMRRSLGEGGAVFVSFLIAISALGAMNATIFTGARTNFAFGQDFRLFRFLGQWNDRAATPGNALIVQGAISLGLVGLGSLNEKGFETMVEYTAPAFWFFFLLSGICVFILRQKDPDVVRPFRVPLYPIVPILFCLTCAYLLYSSLVYTRNLTLNVGTIAGVLVLLAGIPLAFWVKRQQHT